MNPYSEEKRTLAMAVDALADPIANASGWYQLHLIDVRERLYSLWEIASDEAQRWEIASDDAQRWESERPRREAEARLAHHLETDTLDLY
jgi:L-rhamnose mutarotase